MPTDNTLARDILSHLLSTAMEEGDQINNYDTTYDFFQNDNQSFNLITNRDGYIQLAIITADYSTVVRLSELIAAQTERSQIAWDLLEQGGIRQNSFQLLLRKGVVPNSEELKDIDFSQVRIGR